MQNTSDLRLPSYVPEEHVAFPAPQAAVQGTAVSCAGTSPVVAGNATRVSGIRVRAWLPVQVAPALELAGARSTDLPGLPPRGAPV